MEGLGHLAVHSAIEPCWRILQHTTRDINSRCRECCGRRLRWPKTTTQHAVCNWIIAQQRNPWPFCSTHHWQKPSQHEHPRICPCITSQPILTGLSTDLLAAFNWLFKYPAYLRIFWCPGSSLHLLFESSFNSLYEQKYSSTALTHTTGDARLDNH